MISFKSSLPTISLYVLGAYIVIGKMIRRATLSLNQATRDKKEIIDSIIDAYLPFMQKVINTLWNHKTFTGKFVDKSLYTNIKAPLTERYKQCASKQALAIVKSQRKRANKTKPNVHNTSIELDGRFVKIEEGGNSFDLWLKLSILGGKPIYIPAKRHYQFNKFYDSDWMMKKSCRLRRTRKGLFLDVFFEKDAETTKDEGEVVGLDLGFRKLAVLSDGQIVGKDLKAHITRYYKRKRSHLIISETIDHELKKIDFSNMKTLVIEDLKDVKKGKGKKAKKGKRFSRYANRLLAHWAYHRARTKLEMLCEENRVSIASVYPRGTSKACNKCGGIGIRRDERFVCNACGNKDDADHNAACNIRDRFIAQGAYGPLPQNHLDVPLG
jgi:transposase